LHIAALTKNLLAASIVLVHRRTVLAEPAQSEHHRTLLDQLETKRMSRVRKQEALALLAVHEQQAEDRARIQASAKLMLDFQDNEKQRTVLHHAAETNDLDLMALLIQHGANMEIHDEEGLTALMVAAVHNNLGAVRMLLVFGRADPNTMDHYGRTALHCAARYSENGIVKVLIKFGCQPKQKCKGGSDATHVALKHGRKKTAFVIDSSFIRVNRTELMNCIETAKSTTKDGKAAMAGIHFAHQHHEVQAFLGQDQGASRGAPQGAPSEERHEKQVAKKSKKCQKSRHGRKISAALGFLDE
jgi:hypothetical protein